MSNQLEIGEYLKRAGAAAVDAATDPEWKDAAAQAIRDLAATGQPFTSEDVTQRVGQPTGADGEAKPNAVGAVMLAASKRGVIVRDGYTKATRAIRHANMISLWRGK